MSVGNISCNGFDFESYPNDVEEDLIIHVIAQNNNKAAYFAAAATCSLSSINNRPTRGIFVINLAFLKDDAHSDKFINHVFLHEFTHILAFSTSLYPFYWDKDSNSEMGINNVIGSKNYMQ